MKAKSPDERVEFCFQREAWQGTVREPTSSSRKRRSEIARKPAAARWAKAKTD